MFSLSVWVQACPKQKKKKKGKKNNIKVQMKCKRKKVKAALKQINKQGRDSFMSLSSIKHSTIFPCTVFCHSHYPLDDVTKWVHSFKTPNWTLLKPFSLNWIILEMNRVNAGEHFCMQDLHWNAQNICCRDVLPLLPAPIWTKKGENWEEENNTRHDDQK